MTKEITVTGVAITIIGIWLSLEVLASNEAPLLILIWTLIITAVGIAMIIFNKEEDKIEQRKDIKTKKPKQ